MFLAIRLLLSVAADLGLCVGIIDIKSAYVQLDPIRQTIYFRPPRVGRPGMLWKLVKFPYWISEVGC